MWELDHLEGILPVLRKFLAVVGAARDRHGAAKGPNGGEDKVDLHHLSVLGAQVIDRPERLQKVSDRLHHAEVEQRRHVLVVERELEQHRRAVLGEELLGLGLARRACVPLDGDGLLARPVINPRLHVILPLRQVRDVQHTRARDGRGRREQEVADLEDELHVLQHTDALVGGEREQTVVVHHRVHVLDPVGIEVAVEDEPLRVGVGRVLHVTHRRREQAILPLARGHVDEAIQLVGRDGLRVDVLPPSLAHLAALGPHARERLPRHRLVRAREADAEDRVAQREQVLQVDHIGDKVLLGLQPRREAPTHDPAASQAPTRVGLHSRILDKLLKFIVAHAGHEVEDVAEEVLDETHEDDRVVARNLGEVEVTQRAHEQALLIDVREESLLARAVGPVALEVRRHGRPIDGGEHILLGTEEGARDLEHRADGAQAPVIVQLLAGRRRVSTEQVARELVQRVKLLAELSGSGVALGHEHVLHDELKVGDHHSHWAEEHLERLGQLLAPKVAGVHRDERHAAVVMQVELDPDETERGAACTHAVEAALPLDGAHREHLGSEPVKLVEAAPRARRG